MSVDDVYPTTPPFLSRAEGAGPTPFTTCVQGNPSQRLFMKTMSHSCMQSVKNLLSIIKFPWKFGVSRFNTIRRCAVPQSIAASQINIIFFLFYDMSSTRVHSIFNHFLNGIYLPTYLPTSVLDEFSEFWRQL